MKITIKEASKDNFEELMFFRILLLKHDSHLDSGVHYTIENIQNSVKFMKEYLKKNDNKYFIAYHNSLPIGYLHVTHDDKENKQNSYLSELYVLDIYRSFGIGKELTLFQWKYLKKMKITNNTLTTTMYKNKRTIDFYKKSGYVLIKENKIENIVYLSREL